MYNFQYFFMLKMFSVSSDIISTCPKVFCQYPKTFKTVCLMWLVKSQHFVIPILYILRLQFLCVHVWLFCLVGFFCCCCFVLFCFFRTVLKFIKLFKRSAFKIKWDLENNLCRGKKIIDKKVLLLFEGATLTISSCF